MAPASLDPMTLGGEVSEVRALKLEATQRLLGDTIRISDADWQEASLLPGWTRAHVATHLARNADGLRLAFETMMLGMPQRMYASEPDKERDIERGSERNGLALQIDLDVSSGLLNEALDALETIDQAMPVELRAGFRLPARLLPLARLDEVVLHHVDLGVGFTVDDVAHETARRLLEWSAFRLGDREDIPLLELRSSSGLVARLGSYGEVVVVEGDDRPLLGWLTGRGSGDGLEGTDDLVMPLWG
ncbi:maleylpyruvate isomerase family mycothiol-dependent enzyme [Aestuariimicrobium ganziense]|uniref:maleylpyruvate isomerase family mycothiol-dependent enzyme n=1 Tax=Aestuariimicrobium ganziense TaxID=2773677 RepID=UPI001940E15C|nr:maleylpyruvate isomerase family mycothiol-dependent enzyme [Aestuariimicrobium ganziense]